MSKAIALKERENLSAPAKEHKIRDVRYSVNDDRFIVIFDSGKEYNVARSALESDDGSGLASVRVDSKRYFFRVLQTSGNRYEVPWDRILYEAEPSYAHFRGRVRAKNSTLIGQAIRRRREAKGTTQDELARTVGMLRPNLSRIEAGKHRPSLQTLERIAAALKIPVADLITGR